MSDVQKALFSRLKTKADVLDFMAFCDGFLVGAYSTKKVTHSLPGKEWKKWEEVLASIPQSSRRQELQKMREVVRKLPYIQIKLSFNPSMDFIDALHSTLHRKLPSSHILDVAVDPTQSLGAYVSVDGRYYDLTFVKGITPLIKEVVYAK